MDQVFKRMIKMQIVALLIVGFATFAFAGLHGGLSAIAGGFAAIVGGYFASFVASGKPHQDASSVLIRLIKAEALKILIIVLMLWLTFKLYKELVPIALILGLATVALLSGAALSGIHDKK